MREVKWNISNTNLLNRSSEKITLRKTTEKTKQFIICELTKVKYSFVSIQYFNSFEIFSVKFGVKRDWTFSWNHTNFKKMSKRYYWIWDKIKQFNSIGLEIKMYIVHYIYIGIVNSLLFLNVCIQFVFMKLFQCIIVLMHL